MTMRKSLALAGTAALTAGFALFGAIPAHAVAATGWLATLKPVGVNKVAGSGIGWITLTGASAEFTVQVTGLVKQPHATHIHIGGSGSCPTATADHNGKSSTSLMDGAPDYGAIAASLTTTGDTSPSSALALDRYPSAGSYLYKRTFDLDANVLAAVRGGTAVLVVDGIDYNGNGVYDNVLGQSELKSSLTAEATDPALCAAFVGAQMPAVPRGPADTGAGSTAATSHPIELAAGGAALAAAAGLALVARRRRITD